MDRVGNGEMSKDRELEDARAATREIGKRGRGNRGMESAPRFRGGGVAVSEPHGNVGEKGRQEIRQSLIINFRGKREREGRIW